MESKPDLVMTIDDLAEYLKIPKSTVYKLVQEGQIPGQKVGRHWRFRRETIDRWLDEGPGVIPQNGSRDRTAGTDDADSEDED